MIQCYAKCVHKTRVIQTLAAQNLVEHVMEVRYHHLASLAKNVSGTCGTHGTPLVMRAHAVILVLITASAQAQETREAQIQASNINCEAS
jgi:hypothetical protein